MGPLSPLVSTASISVPRPPNEVGADILHKELWLSVGGCDQIERRTLLQLYQPDTECSSRQVL
jgi:hypothetical protein